MSEDKNTNAQLLAGSSPVDVVPDEATSSTPSDGIGLCLSGGGYRAMLFHVGTLWRINDAELLPTLTKISSVSGGSIASAVLGINWNRLELPEASSAPCVSTTFVDQVVKPIRSLASTTIDRKSILKGILWFGTINDRIVRSYRNVLY